MGSGAKGKPCGTWGGAWVHGGFDLFGGFINDVMVMHDIHWAQYYYASVTNMTFQKWLGFLLWKSSKILEGKIFCRYLSTMYYLPYLVTIKYVC